MEIRAIPLRAIQPNPEQPRSHFDPVKLAELAVSIKARGGVENPIVVTPNGGPESFILVSGERRWRAAKQAGLTTIDAVIKPKKTGLDLATAALLENMHRSDLSAVEEARAFKNLMDAHGLDVLNIAELTGKSASQIYNRLTWLKLENAIQELEVAGRLHGDVKVAQALLKLPAGKTRMQLAQELSKSGASIKAICLACDKLAERLEARQPQSERSRHPMKHTAVERARTEPKAADVWPLPAVRAAAQTMCAKCEIKTGVLLGQAQEPAWTLLTHAADETCEACNVRSIKGACAGCPGVELLHRLITTKGDKPNGRH